MNTGTVSDPAGCFCMFVCPVHLYFEQPEVQIAFFFYLGESLSLSLNSPSTHRNNGICNFEPNESCPRIVPRFEELTADKLGKVRDKLVEQLHQ